MTEGITEHSCVPNYGNRENQRTQMCTQFWRNISTCVVLWKGKNHITANMTAILGQVEGHWSLTTKGFILNATRKKTWPKLEPHRTAVYWIQSQYLKGGTKNCMLQKMTPVCIKKSDCLIKVPNSLTEHYYWNPNISSEDLFIML